MKPKFEIGDLVSIIDGNFPNLNGKLAIILDDKPVYKAGHICYHIYLQEPIDNIHFKQWYGGWLDKVE